MPHLPRPLARAAVLTCAVVASAGVAPALAAARPPQNNGAVYLDDNTAGHNTIAAFTPGADGRLTPVSGSPFDAGGAGTGTGIPSQGAVQVSSDHRFLLAVDAGSNEISVLRLAPGGGLRLVSTAPSGGNEPVSIAEHDGLVYVANAGAGGSDYTGFTLDPNGRLSPIAGSTVALPDDAQPGDVLFNATGTNLAATRVGSSLIDSFSVGGDGRLTPAAGSPYAAQAAGPFGSVFSPTHANELFVSNAHAGAGNGTVSAFSVAGDGTLSSIGSSPFPDGQTAPCWVEISHDGTVLFAVNTASGTISSDSVAPDGTLTLIGSTPVSNSGGVGAVDSRLSPDGRTLYVNESRIGTVGEFAVNGGTLTELGSVALPAGATPAGLAVR